MARRFSHHHHHPPTRPESAVTSSGTWRTVCYAPGLSRICWVCARFRDGYPQHMLCSKITESHVNGHLFPSNKPQPCFFLFWSTSGRPWSSEGALRTVPVPLHLTPHRCQRCSVAGRRKLSLLSRNSGFDWPVPSTAVSLSSNRGPRGWGGFHSPLYRRLIA